MLWLAAASRRAMPPAVRGQLKFSLEFEVDLGTDGPRLVDGVANQLRDVELELRVVRGHQRRLVGQVVNEQMRGPRPVREREPRIRDGVGRQVHAEVVSL